MNKNYIELPEMKFVDFHTSLVTVLVTYNMEDVKSAFLPDILKNFQVRFSSPAFCVRSTQVCAADAGGAGKQGIAPYSFFCLGSSIK